MKNIKYIIIGILISFIIIFIINIITFNINSNQTIHINSYEGYEEAKNTLSKKIDKVKNDDCRSSLNNMLKRIDDNNLKGDVKIGDYINSYFKDNLTFVDYYSYVSDSCNISDDKIYIKAMSTLVYPNYIKDKYNRSYELHIIDLTNQTNISDDVGTYTTMLNELGVLSDILGELS